MSDTPQTQPPGWYYAQGDPPGTQRYWDGQKWEGGPQPVPGASQDAVAGAVPGLAEPIMRIGARVIDYIVWFIVTIIPSIIVVGGLAVANNGNDVSFIAGFFATLVAVAIITAYETFLVGTRGQTLGKMALGLKVVRADGSPPDMRDGFMRILPYSALTLLGAIIPFLPGLITFVIGLVSLVFLFTDANRQTVWDKFAKTLVVTA
jgi:uncharacterized RDD family membrane protein YckC